MILIKCTEDTHLKENEFNQGQLSLGCRGVTAGLGREVPRDDRSYGDIGVH